MTKLRPVNPLVGGSNPSRGAMKNSNLTSQPIVQYKQGLDRCSPSFIDSETADIGRSVTGSIPVAPTTEQSLASDDRNSGQQLASSASPIPAGQQVAVKSTKLTPYQRIVRAAKTGTGVRLTADEAWQMARDTAILQRAEWDDDPEGEREQIAADMQTRRNS